MIVELQIGKPEFELGLSVGFPREVLTMDTTFKLDGVASLIDSIEDDDVTSELISTSCISRYDALL